MSTHRSLLCVALTALLGAAACSTGTATNGASTTSAGAEKAQSTPKQAVADAALVIDVRTADEFATGHLPQALNIPVDEVDAHLDEIAGKVEGDKSKPIAVYCASGNRAGRAKAILEKAGFQNVTNAGGYGGLKD